MSEQLAPLETETELLGPEYTNQIKSPNAEQLEALN